MPLFLVFLFSSFHSGGVGSTVACESALRSAGTLLSRVRAPLPAPWPDGGPESLRSPCCGLAIYKKTQTLSIQFWKAVKKCRLIETQVNLCNLLSTVYSELTETLFISTTENTSIFILPLRCTGILLSQVRVPLPTP
ncbi:hypothetical protein PoB_006532300 [Plakobranchus ocellatus]|uniref:Secreted protein n=1 Tax=Plakobranchus ocellatus TaxID=259542 RepID=A0AAV4D3R0_9GAST|nr:hypothetical protein PoB_006532300 [Plakobranchus ocellatus]